MDFKIGEKYRFNDCETLNQKIRGKKFSVIRVFEDDCVWIQIWGDDNSLIISPNGKDYWVADPPNSDRWEDFLCLPWGKSFLEFKFV